MYFPYLYARAAELAALRDVASTGRITKVTPVLEPFTLKAAPLTQTITALAASHGRAYIVTNPTLGEFETPGNVPAWLAAIEAHPGANTVVIPTFQITSTTTSSQLDAFLARHQDEIGIVIRTPDAISPTELRLKLDARLRMNKAIVFLHRTADPATYTLALGAAHTVMVKDSFITKPTNAEYSGAEWFTSDHLSFKTDGLPGLSDFTVLPPEPRTGGGKPRVVVAHMSFQHKGAIWVQHFHSNHPPSAGSTPASMILEAAQELDGEKTLNPTKFVTSPGIDAYDALLRTRRATNLTKNKQFQIAHHLFTVANLI